MRTSSLAWQSSAEIREEFAGRANLVLDGVEVEDRLDHDLAGLISDADLHRHRVLKQKRRGCRHGMEPTFRHRPARLDGLDIGSIVDGDFLFTRHLQQTQSAMTGWVIKKLNRSEMRYSSGWRGLLAEMWGALEEEVEEAVASEELNGDEVADLELAIERADARSRVGARWRLLCPESYQPFWKLPVERGVGESGFDRDTVRVLARVPKSKSSMRSKTPSRARSSAQPAQRGLVLKAVTGKRRFRAKRRFLREPLLVLQVEYDTRIPEGPCLALAGWHGARPDNGPGLPRPSPLAS
jgi:hypothetical protein